MRFVLLISLALCGAARAQRDELGSTSMKLSDFKLLNKFLATAASMVQNVEIDPVPAKKTNLVPTPLSRPKLAFARPNQYLLHSYQASEESNMSNEPKQVNLPVHTSPQKLYSSDGPFSDIPSDAFHLDHRKEFREGSHVIKKDLSRPTLDPPKELVDTCLEYFRGGSHSPSATELILNICTELLDTERVDEFSLDDEKRQDLYNLRADDHHHHSLDSEECECCPLGHHVRGDGVARTEHLLNDLLKMFKPVGHRRDWMILNSLNPDKRLRTYIDLQK